MTRQSVQAAVVEMDPTDGSKASIEARPPLHALTGIRIFAALGVLLFHYGAGFAERIHAPQPITTLLRNGNLGVSFFFVLSGFVLTYTYLGRLGNRSSMLEYVAARFSRIYPVYLLALLIALPVHVDPITLGDAGRVLLMVQSWTYPSSTTPNAWVTQAWTLSVEMFFYICFPLILPVVSRCSRRWSVATAIGIALVICLLGVAKIAPGTDRIPSLSESMTPILPILRATEFVLGMLACRIFLLTPGAVLKRYSGWKTTVTALLILAILSTSLSARGTSIATVLFSILIVQLASGAGGLARALSAKPMLILGGASYALYITQGPVREWLRLLVPSPWDAWVGPAASITFALVVYLLFEQPLQRRLRSKFRALLTDNDGHSKSEIITLIERSGATRNRCE